MKTVRIFNLGLGLVIATSVRGLASDDGSSSDSGRSVDPSLYTDAAPQSVIHQYEPLTDQQKAALAEMQQKQEEEKNWLTLSYSQQLKNRTTATEGGSFAQISADRDLAKLAGLKPPVVSATPSLKVTATQSPSPNSNSPTPSSSSPNPFSSSLSPVDDISKPLLAPLSDIGPSQSSADTQATATTAPTPANKSPDSMEVPGLTAAEMGEPPDDNKLTLQLPDETNYNPPSISPTNIEAPHLTLSSVTAEAQIEKQNEKLRAPGSTPDTAVVVKPTESREEEEKMIAPVTSSLRTQVADPLQIPYH